MNDDVRRAASAWATTALREVELSGFAQIDLDHLAGVALDPLLAVDVMRVALKTAMEVTPDLEGAVVLQLEPSEMPRRACPEWPALLHRYEELRATLSVPGIYLLAAGHPHSDVDDENYTAPVRLPSELGSGITGFYREWRTANDRAKGWEYNRAIYLMAAS